jgi:type IV pilus assembly protein PilQ
MTISSIVFGAFLASAQLVSLDIRELDLREFLRIMANAATMNIVLHPAVEGKVNLMVKDAPWEQLMDAVLKNFGLRREVEGNIMRIAPAATFEVELRQIAATEDARIDALPLQTYVYILNYARAADMAVVVSRMLSPRGSVVVYPQRNALIVRDVAPPPQPLR